MTDFIDIRPVQTVQDKTAFIRAPYAVFADDPYYVPSLEFQMRERLDPKTNLILQGAEHQLWVAYRGEAAVGRISALVNPLYLDRYNDGAGHFGFLDAVDDAAVFDALVKTAEDWCRAKGMKKMMGPFSFSVNEECGMLIDGFDSPPYVMMPHGRPYYQAHMERLGFTKAHDMHALRYRNERQFIPERRQRFVEKKMSDPKVTLRNLNPKTFNEDIKTLVGIFNDAWTDNWGFVPLTDAQAEHMASDLRPIITKENVVLCYVDNEPVAFGLVLPNINEAIADFGGKLAPFNWVKLLWRLQVKGLKTRRMPLMGVVKRLQGKPLGAAFAYKIIDMVNTANMDRGTEESELSWILESNPDMLNMLTDMGGEIYKTYRIYERAVAQ